MSKDNGGPAFPAHPSAMGDHDGMTLRDYFAAKAMPAIYERVTGGTSGGGFVRIASLVYEMADAMIAERNKQ